MKKTREQLKTALMGQVEEAIERMLEWLEVHPSFTLSELEDFVLQLRQEVGVTVAEAAVGQLQSKQPVEAPACPTCGERMEYKGQREKGVASRLGTVELERSHYYCPRCQAGLFPPG